MGCEANPRDMRVETSVSIHAPVWGANGRGVFSSYAEIVSIHAPVWGANSKRECDRYKVLFQSTHPCGVRSLSEFLIMHSIVSIHAPVWGAKIVAFDRYACVCFNPRTRVGCEHY